MTPSIAETNLIDLLIFLLDVPHRDHPLPRVALAAHGPDQLAQRALEAQLGVAQPHAILGTARARDAGLRSMIR